MGNHKLFHHSSHSIILLLVISLYLSRSSSAQYSITGYDPADLRSENRLAGLFLQWKDKHGKTYRNVEETAKRFENFRRNLEFIVEWNSKRTGHTVGLNRFADLSNEEFREVYFSKIKRPVRFSKPSYTRQRLASVCNAPVSLDWRKRGVVTEVKDQGQCGNCWAFSATGAIEGINAINTGELINLSEQELIHHITSQDGFDGVFASDAFEWVINNGGIDTDDKGASKVVSIDNYEAVEESESGLLCAIVNQPVSVSIDGSTLDFQLYTGGIYEGSCSSNPKDTNHEVLVVGYGSQDGKDYWIVKNSWGTNWGINGYVYIRRNTNLPYGVCAINSLAYYPTQTPLAISPYPSPSPPPPPSPSPPPPPPSPPPPSPSHPPPPPSPPLPPPPLPPSPPPPPPPPSPPPPSPSPPPPSPPPSPPPPPPPPSPSPPPPPPPPSPSPPPPRPPLPPKPPCPPPTPVNCSCFTYCPPGQTCCCLQKFFNICLIHGCCEFPDAVCCAGSNYCCPSEHPICNIHDGLCLKNPGDHFGVPAKKKKMAKHKFPWTKFEENEEMTCQPLKWRVNQFAIAALG